LPHSVDIWSDCRLSITLRPAQMVELSIDVFHHLIARIVFS